MMDAEDSARVQQSLAAELVILMRAIRGTPRAHWGMDTRFIEQVCRNVPAQSLTPRQIEHVRRVAWKLRRYLPAHLAPKLNPDDPIVRELHAKDDAHG